MDKITRGQRRKQDNGYQLVKPEKMLDDWLTVYRFNRYVRRKRQQAHSSPSIIQALRG